MTCIHGVSNIVSISANMSDWSPFGLPELSSRPLPYLRVPLNLSPPKRKKELVLKISYSVSFKNIISIML
jgi:hypothetical protein